MTYPQGPSEPYDSQTGQAAAQYPPPQPSDTADDFILSALVAAIIAGWALSKVAGILRQAQDVEPDTVRWLMVQTQFVQLLSLSELPPTASPLANQRRQNAFRRATYILNATRRMTTAFRQAASVKQDEHGRWPDGRTPGSIIGAAWKKELNNMRAHIAATHKRNEAAIQVNRTWQSLGKPRLLGWRAMMDDRTTAECRAANGRNFDPTRVPPIGYPGAVHPNCRCRAVRPFRTDLRVEDLPNPRMMFDGVVAAANGSWRVTTNM